MTTPITVVGGGIAGLTAAIECAQAGAKVELHEAHSTLGGRGRATPAPYIAHEGPHVFYADGPHYRWLKRQGFVGGLGWPAPTAFARAGFLVDGRIRRVPPFGMLKAQARPGASAPVDADFHSWASEKFGAQSAHRIANAIGVATYDSDTGRLSAAFVWNLFHRIYAPRVPGVRWVRGGWQTVIDRMCTRAAELGVEIRTESRVGDLPTTPTIVATELSSARALLKDESLVWTSGACVMLDVALPTSRRDCRIVADLDGGGFHESYSMQDRSTAPRGESLYQLDMPIRPNESIAQARARLNRFADTVLPEWRDRATWQRTATARNRTGAIDLPGHTWRDRPAIDRGSDVYLAGDMVAAPGMRGEISVNSAVDAAHRALQSVHVRT
ncbi:FAD-dependent oxidoreductase [Rhodococcus sp. NPDC058521]|uniref:FAD-dependent oxidoreductase n=1 Tax=Rhodococcus sp. NPDC058521 TaxID=3346536 RepID=UPI00365CFB5B